MILPTDQKIFEFMFASDFTGIFGMYLAFVAVFSALGVVGAIRCHRERKCLPGYLAGSVLSILFGMLLIWVITLDGPFEFTGISAPALLPICCGIIGVASAVVHYR